MSQTDYATTQAEVQEALAAYIADEQSPIMLKIVVSDTVARSIAKEAQERHVSFYQAARERLARPRGGKA
jgi:hypothetical protein